jgi:pyruvate/2-oxoglutarate dehydrogenase complex dihydrolipoamide dehydrogenase (E3) component
VAATLTPDLCVIGAGASGLAVAMAARRLGASVVVVEKGAPGGMSPRTGALGLSALSAAARRAAAMTGSEPFGIIGEGAKVSLRKVHDHVAGIMSETAADDGPARLAAMEIELVSATGAFINPTTIRAGDTDIRARRFVIATGGRALLPDLPGLTSVPWFTPETIFDNTRKLAHLVVIGAGPMGLELALCYRRLGTEVTVVESGKALAASDPELAEIALRRLRDEGVMLHEGSAVVAAEARGQGIALDVRAGDDRLSLEASHILVAAGRAANLSELNLEAAKIRRSKADSGALALSDALRTSNARVYAVGEAAGHAPAAHLAALEADIVVKAALLGQPARYDPNAFPRATLTDPPIAEIGLTEPMARTRFKDAFTVHRASYADSDAARAARQGMGLVKLVVSSNGRILGAGIAGEDAPELIALIGLAMSAKLTLARLADFAAPYPSHAELIRGLGAAAAPAAPAAWQSRLFRLRRLLP